MGKLESFSQGEIGETRSLGTVMAAQANFYRVQLDCDERQRSLLCTRRSLLKKIGQQVMTGDRVWVEESDRERGSIVEVLPRSTVLDRPAVANATQLLLVFALNEPVLDSWQLSRFLVKAESTALALCLCLNKGDLVDRDTQMVWRDRLESWGYSPYLLSVKTETGLGELEEALRDRVTILAGPSGVGKSSLINRLIPNVDQRINRVSGKLQKGRHTTRHVELFSLPAGGLVADTPGFNQPDLTVSPVALMEYFPEIRKRQATEPCQFQDCWHRDEPNCKVRGEWERYAHYRQLLEEAIAQQELRQQSPGRESKLKLKIREAGKHDYEPKLENKKYRRISRRFHHQSLQERIENLSLDDWMADE